MDALIRINEVFAESVYASYKRKRYGLKTCSALISEELSDDLRNLLIRGREMEQCACTMPGICSLSKIEEKINTI
jgi:hypothetical protein